MGSSRPQTPGLAQKLYDIRAHLNLSQSKMVERLKGQNLPSALRIHAGNISRFENGTREPSPLVLLAYARSARITLEVLIDADVDLPPRIAQSPDVKSKSHIPRGSPTRAKSIGQKKKKIG